MVAFCKLEFIATDDFNGFWTVFPFFMYAGLNMSAWEVLLTAYFKALLNPGMFRIGETFDLFILRISKPGVTYLLFFWDKLFGAAASS